MLRLGVPMGPATLLTVRGYTSGQPRTTPVVLFENKGHRWLIAVFGEVNWVRNLRAAGEGILTRGHHRQEVVAVELTAEAAGPVLKDVLEPFLKRRPRARRMLRTYYRVEPDASLNEFIKEAQRHPVFELRESGLP
jgi:deazaflavin-dependent oxidoreductase (nitroreductase family)